MNFNKFYLILSFLFMAFAYKATGQDYQAVHGSIEAGSLSVLTNPASALYVPFTWDITPFSLQVKQSTNGFIIKNFSLLSPGKNADIEAEPGTRKRFVFTNQEIRLLNTRIRLNKNNAIAFGASIRSYQYANSSVLTFKNRFRSFYDFLDLNYGNIPISGKARAASWAEIYATYARNFTSNDNMIINGGITLKLNRSLAGGWLNLDNATYSPGVVNDRPAYILLSGKLQYGYSSNIDELNGNGSSGNKINNFLKKTTTGVSANLGIECIVPVEKEGDTKNEYNYDFKLGISVLDIGVNRYSYSTNSKIAIHNKDNISDSLIEATISGVTKLDDFDDSLNVIAGPLSTLTGNFNILQPTRLVINADKYISDDFFINAELTLPLTTLLAKDQLVLRDISLLAVTPRYETKTFGLYLPLTFNTQKQLWVGGAFKIGPLLFGLYNLANIFSKNKIQRGGGYLALTFRPGKNQTNGNNKGLSKEEKKQLRQLDCPKF